MDFDVAPTPIGWKPEYRCGCSLMDGRCPTHAEAMQRIYAAWYHGAAEQAEAIWAQADGYGSPGSVPIQGLDWSGIRDSTPAAIERMLRTLGDQ